MAEILLLLIYVNQQRVLFVKFEEQVFEPTRVGQEHMGKFEYKIFSLPI